MSYMEGQTIRFTRLGWNPDSVKIGVVVMWFGGDHGVFDVMCEGYRMTLDNWDQHETVRKEDAVGLQKGPIYRKWVYEVWYRKRGDVLDDFKSVEIAGCQSIDEVNTSFHSDPRFAGCVIGHCRRMRKATAEDFEKPKGKLKMEPA
jgi:hypothetical protein